MAGLTAYFLRPDPESPAVASPPMEEPDEPSERPTRPPAPRRPDLPPLPAAEDPDTGYAMAPEEEEPPARFAVLHGRIVDTNGRPQPSGMLIADEDDCPRLGWTDGAV